MNVNMQIKKFSILILHEATGCIFMERSLNFKVILVHKTTYTFVVRCGSLRKFLNNVDRPCLSKKVDYDTALKFWAQQHPVYSELADLAEDLIAYPASPTNGVHLFGLWYAVYWLCCNCSCLTMNS